MFFGVLDSSGRLDFINAGHPPPLILRHGQIVEPFLDNSFPVGLIPDAEYTVSSVTLEVSDTLVLFSDGVTEAMDPDEGMFGRPGLLEALKGQRDPPLDQLQKTILDAVETTSRETGLGMRVLDIPRGCAGGSQNCLKALFELMANSACCMPGHWYTLVNWTRQSAICIILRIRTTRSTLCVLV